MSQVYVLNRVTRVVRSLRVVPVAVAVAAILGLTLAATQFTAAPSAHAASANLHYQRGYYLDNGWFCYGWDTGYYRCTHHWHRSGGRVISDNPAWVPNYGLTTTSTSSAGSSHSSSTPAKKAPAPAPVHTAPAPAPAPSGSVQGMIEQVFGAYAGQAIAVARCESGLNPGATNPIAVGNSHAAGVFQILYPSTWAGTSYAGYSPYNAWAKINAAHQIFGRDGSSWREWVCQP